MNTHATVAEKIAAAGLVVVREEPYEPTLDDLYTITEYSEMSTDERIAVAVEELEEDPRGMTQILAGGAVLTVRTDRALYERVEQVREDVIDAEVIGAIPTFIARRALDELADDHNSDDVAAMIEAVAKVWHGPAHVVLTAFVDRENTPSYWRGVYGERLRAAEAAAPALYALAMIATEPAADGRTRRIAKHGLVNAGAGDVARAVTRGITDCWLGDLHLDVEDRRTILRALAAVEIVKHVSGVAEPSTAI